MITDNYAQVQLAYNYFKRNINMKVTVPEIAFAIGWKESTVRTYFNKKWNELILNRTARGVYQICMSREMNLEQFTELHSQVDTHLR